MQCKCIIDLRLFGIGLSLFFRALWSLPLDVFCSVCGRIVAHRFATEPFLIMRSIKRLVSLFTLSYRKPCMDGQMAVGLQLSPLMKNSVFDPPFLADHLFCSTSYEATSSRRRRSLARGITTAPVAAVFLGFGSMFVLLASGVYVWRQRTTYVSVYARFMLFSQKP